MSMKIFVAMSGGVDSSVAAALLKEQGHDVTGITMQLWPRLAKDVGTGCCCGLDAIDDARRVAAVIDIPHYVVNMRDAFEIAVIDNFISEYRLGRTPNPCVKCNQMIKFDILLKKVIGMGADKLATGHYARIATAQSEKSEIKNKKSEITKKQTGNDLTPHASRLTAYKLLKGLDAKKDQSYFLWTFTQDQLAKTLLPLGELTKDKVREKARVCKLPVAEKAESQEICFVPEDKYRDFLRERGVPDNPGPIVDIDGRVLGRHDGVSGFTVGQRRGLGVASGRPLYVVSIDAGANTVVVGPEEGIRIGSLSADHANFISGESPKEFFNVNARIRYNAPDIPAVVTPLARDRLRVDLAEPQRAIAPGQSVVFYDGQELLGGAVIFG